MVALYEKLKRQLAEIEFKKMYSEIGEELVKKASQLGEKHRRERIKFYKGIEEVLTYIQSKFDNEFFVSDVSKTMISSLAGGIDGSSQITGGEMGIYYIVASAVLIIYRDSLKSSPKIRSIAGIREIDEVEERQVNLIKELYMLGLENRAIRLWSSFIKNNGGTLFIDGPIIDPPHYYDKNYVNDRIKVIRKAMKKSLVIGCVKRLRGRAFINFLKNNLNDANLKILEKYKSDRDVLPALFVKFRKENKISDKPIATRYFDLTESNMTINIKGIYETYKAYYDKGIKIISFFYDRSNLSKVLRIDIPVESDIHDEEIEELYIRALSNLEYWSYSSDPYPWLVFLADKLSNIGKGAADLLYNEIVSRESVVEDDVLFTKFKTR